MISGIAGALAITEEGTVRVPYKADTGDLVDILFFNAAYAPNYAARLISITQLSRQHDKKGRTRIGTEGDEIEFIWDSITQRVPFDTVYGIPPDIETLPQLEDHVETQIKYSDPTSEFAPYQLPALDQEYLAAHHPNCSACILAMQHKTPWHSKGTETSSIRKRTDTLV